MPNATVPRTLQVPVLSGQLDRVERVLPPVPSRVLRLQRELAAFTYDRLSAIVGTVADATRTVAEVTRVSARTTAGQGSAAVADVARTARADAKQVAGQARAQARRVATEAESETVDLLDAGVDALDDRPGSGTPYEQWTRADLLERARERGVTGAYRMNKAELIDALRA
jgi:hypothetical protein